MIWILKITTSSYFKATSSYYFQCSEKLQLISAIIKTNEEELNQNFLKFNRFSKLIDVDLRLQSQKQAIMEYTSILFKLFNEINEEFDSIIVAILFAQQNTLHPIVITPNDLKNE